MGRGWSLEYDKTLHHSLLRLFHSSYHFLRLLLTQSSHSLRRCCFLPLMLHYLMNHLILTGQASDLGLRNRVMGFLPHQERMEVIHKQSQLRICQWSTTGFALLNSHILFHQSPSLGLELVVN